MKIFHCATCNRTYHTLLAVKTGCALMPLELPDTVKSSLTTLTIKSLKNYNVNKNGKFRQIYKYLVFY